jgi:hypothetical protein
MRSLLLSLILFSLSFSLWGKELCFYQSIHGQKMEHEYRHRAQAFLIKAVSERREGEWFKSSRYDMMSNCVKIEAGPWITSLIEGVHEEKIKKWPSPTGEIVKRRVDVILRDPDIKKREAAYAFLELPKKSVGILYDEKKREMKIGAQMVHEEIIQYTVEYLGETKTFYRGIASVREIVPVQYMGKDVDMAKAHLRKFYVKRDNQLLPIEHLRVHARAAGTYPKLAPHLP